MYFLEVQFEKKYILGFKTTTFLVSNDYLTIVLQLNFVPTTETWEDIRIPLSLNQVKQIIISTYQIINCLNLEKKIRKAI